MNKEDIINKAKEIQKKINQKKELADIRVFLDKNKDKIVSLNIGFNDLYIEVGKEGDDKTQKLRQYTFLLSYILLLIKGAGIPDSTVKQELINEIQNALYKGKI